jgi:hypothetical protein
MAHSEGHSSTERTILWIIIPATIAVSLYFTSQSHKHEFNRGKLSGDLGDLKKKEAPAPVKMESHEADTLHLDTAHMESGAMKVEHVVEDPKPLSPAKH